MELNQCQYGVLVESEHGEIGMIVGITNNAKSAELSVRKKKIHAIPIVQWSYGETSSIHYENIKKL